MLLKKCNFLEPIIPCEVFGIVFDIKCLLTIMVTLGTTSQSFYKNIIFSIICDIVFYFAWVFTAVLLSQYIKNLYEMNKTSI